MAYCPRMAKPVRVGVTINFSYPKPGRALYIGKTLQYVEESLFAGLVAAGATPVVVPDLSPWMPDRAAAVAPFAEALDGLLLSGGADVAPASYGHPAPDERWPGDPRRDAYELALLEACRARALPILGLCRGAQLLNVALGGSLYQDITTHLEGADIHRDAGTYDDHGHHVVLEPDSWVHGVYQVRELPVNSVHHQAVDRPGEGCAVVARSREDGVVEGIERIRSNEWMVGLQWHPEWLPGRVPGRADGAPVFEAFVDVVRRRTR